MLLFKGYVISRGFHCRHCGSTSVVRETALKIGITHVTAFSWRHKVLSALAKERVGILEGLVEVDETYFLESYKGRRVQSESVQVEF